MTLTLQLTKTISDTSDGKCRLRIWVSGTENVDEAVFLVRHIQPVPGGQVPSSIFIRFCTVSDLYNYPVGAHDTIRSHFRVSHLDFVYTSRITAEKFWQDTKTAMTDLLAELKAVSDAPEAEVTLVEL